MKSYLETVKEFQQKTWGIKEGKTVEHYFAKDADIHSAIGGKRGMEYMQEVVDTWLEGIPDMEVDWQDYICDGDKVVCRWVSKGMHRATLFGYAETGRRVEYSGVTIYKFNEAGKISDYWAFVDRDGLKSQIK